LRAAQRLGVGLLSFVRLNRFLDFRLNGVQVEGCGVLHRRIIDGCDSKFSNSLLYDHETPKLSGHEVVHVAAAQVIQRFAANRGCPLEWVLANMKSSER
jgi:hypothetical protein